MDETKSEKLIFNYCVTGINFKHELSGLITKLLNKLQANDKWILINNIKIKLEIFNCASVNTTTLKN